MKADLLDHSHVLFCGTPEQKRTFMLLRGARSPEAVAARVLRRTGEQGAMDRARVEYELRRLASTCTVDEQLRAVRATRFEHVAAAAASVAELDATECAETAARHTKGAAWYEIRAMHARRSATCLRVLAARGRRTPPSTPAILIGGREEGVPRRRRRAARSPGRRASRQAEGSDQPPFSDEAGS